MSVNGAFFSVKLQKKALLTVPNSSLWEFVHMLMIFGTSPRMLIEQGDMMTLHWGYYCYYACCAGLGCHDSFDKVI